MGKLVWGLDDCMYILGMVLLCDVNFKDEGARWVCFDIFI